MSYMGSVHLQNPTCQGVSQRCSNVCVVKTCIIAKGNGMETNGVQCTQYMHINIGNTANFQELHAHQFPSVFSFCLTWPYVYRKPYSVFEYFFAEFLETQGFCYWRDPDPPVPLTYSTPLDHVV